MYEQKTKLTQVSVEAFLNTISDEAQCQDAKTICSMMQEVTGLQPRMWGPSIVGFGTYHYKYESGHEGDAALIGFSPRKGNTTVYISNGFEKYASLLKKLGKCKTGVVCLYIKQLRDVDMEILRQIMSESFTYMKEKYPDWKKV